mgnify:CR=1 FL=1
MSEMYPTFAETARAEGFPVVAAVFDAVAVAEKQHEKRFQALAENVAAGRVFKRDTPVAWRCLNCGYVHTGPEAPLACPACAHKREQFEILAENW